MPRWLLLWVAQGFGSGRFPWAPGTAGSLVGLAWFLILVTAGNLFVYVSGVVLGFFMSVAVCGRAERLLEKKDPSSVVLDEITALPLCFLGWLWTVCQKGPFPPPDYFLRSSNVALILILFFLFRLFDIAKPWPIRTAQNLPGGWGITVDDYLAAVYVNVIFALGKMAQFLFTDPAR